LHRANRRRYFFIEGSDLSTQKKEKSSHKPAGVLIAPGSNRSSWRKKPARVLTNLSSSTFFERRVWRAPDDKSV